MKDLSDLLGTILLIELTPILIGIALPCMRSAIGWGAGLGAGLTVVFWLIAIYPDRKRGQR